MCGPEEWPSRRSSPADRIRLTDPAAKFKSTYGGFAGECAVGVPMLPARFPFTRYGTREPAVYLGKRTFARRPSDRAAIESKIHAVNPNPRANALTPMATLPATATRL